MVVAKEKKKEVMSHYRAHDKDTGSAKVQVALLTERINGLTEHFKSYKRDHSSRQGLLKLVGKRRRLLDYLKRIDHPGYLDIIKKLDLRK
ncbi:MAG: 30S ribosomal protein S15 [Candidatus Omnitrophica bacterium]|nr:30S ribosomal protein S15 [Candidatus Omnitrophota bacterium]